MHRRNFLKASAALGPAIVAIRGTPALGQATVSLAELADKLDVSLFSSDGLAVPLPDKPTPSPFAVGLVSRTLVLGGGGTYYLAWYCGFFHGLFDEGIDVPSLAQMIVGTSAGSYAGSSMASGHFQRMRTEFDFFAHFPELFAKLAPVSEPNASQNRAQQINAAAEDGSVATRRMIGHAALAADNHLNGPVVERLAALITGDSKTSWPTAKMLTTAIDCYSGDRIVVSQVTAGENNIPLAHGAAAKLLASWNYWADTARSALLHGRRHVLDPAHVDLVAGSKRALVITLNDGLKPPFLTGIPHPIGENIRQIEATGTKTLWIKADPPNVNLMNPLEILPALRTGYDRAKLEATEIKAFWS